MARTTRRDDALILALARGVTVRSAAKVSGYSEWQAHRKLEDPDFSSRVTETRQAIVGRSVGILSAAGTEAARSLRKLLASPSDQVRLAAARAILELGGKLRDSLELTERIEALERQQEKQASGPGGNGHTVGMYHRGAQ